MKLNNEKLSDLVRDLWSFYLKDINSRLPVYFCFTKSQIREVLIKNNLISSDYLNDFCRIAKKFLEIKNEQILISESLYQPVWNKTSGTILLIALQVLAVELMDKSEQGIGADAYFPRLRKLLGVKDELEGRNPFSESDFIKLWKTFENEILHLGGCSNTITFQEGYGRKDKNRNFPISQALLSQNELFVVLSLIYKNQNEFPRINELPLTLVKLRSELPSRVREKYDRPFQKARIIDQIFSLSKTIDQSKVKHLSEVNSRLSKDEDQILKAFFDGFFEEKIFFEAYLKTGEKLDEQVSSVNSFVKNSMLILGRNSADEFNWSNDVNSDLVDFEDFLIVFDENKIAQFNLFCSNYLSPQSSKIFVECDIQNIKVLKYSRIDVEKNCIVRNGREIRSNLDRKPDLLTLNGGINLGENRFLCSFPIFSFSYGGNLISNSEYAKLNGSDVSVVDIIARLNSATRDELFEIEYNGAKKNVKFVSSNETSQRKKFGYQIINSRLNPIKTEIDTVRSSIYGFNHINHELREKLKSVKFHTLLLNIIHLQDGIELTSEQKKLVLESIDSLEIKEHLKKIMKSNIEAIGRIPDQFVSFF